MKCGRSSEKCGIICELGKWEGIREASWQREHFRVEWLRYEDKKEGLSRDWSSITNSGR